MIQNILDLARIEKLAQVLFALLWRDLSTVSLRDVGVLGVIGATVAGGGLDVAWVEYCMRMATAFFDRYAIKSGFGCRIDEVRVIDHLPHALWV